LALSSQKNKKVSLSREQESDEDELAFISRKICKMWKNKDRSKMEELLKKISRKRKKKTKTS